MGTTDKLINNLLENIAKPENSAQLTAPPSPIFISKAINNPHSPKTSQLLTPPRSPGGDKLLGRTFSPKMSNQLLFPDLKQNSGAGGLRDSNDRVANREDTNSLEMSKDSRSNANHSATFSYNENWSKTDGALQLANAFK